MPADPAAWADRQIPVGEEVFIDHIGYFVDDLAAAGEQLTRLGFGVSPINLQTNRGADGELRPSGTSNRLALMRRGFIECLAATHDTPLADQLKADRQRYAGLHLIALSYPHPDRQRARLLDAGFDLQPTVDLRWPRPTADGERHVAWTVIRPQPGVMPEGRVQYALCHTPEIYWPPDEITPVNAADGLGDVLIVAADPADTAARFGRFTDRQPTTLAGLVTVVLDRGRLIFASTEQAAAMLPGFAAPALPFIAGFALRSRDLTETGKVLAAGGVAPLLADTGRVCVGPADGLGAYMLFHDPALAAPWHSLAEQAS